jgi:Uma2 family endonuclease
MPRGDAMTTATLSEQLLTDEQRAGDILYEVEYGRIVEKPVSAYTLWIASWLMRALGPHVEDNRIGTAYMEMVFVLAPGLKRRPDLAFLANATWPIDQPPPPEGDWAIIPDLAVEVISPNNLYSNIVAKLREYFEAGVTEVWVVVPESRIVQVFRGIDQVRTVEAGQDLTSEMIPGWSINVGKLLPHVFPRPEETE